MPKALPSDDKELALFEREFPELPLSFLGKGLETAGEIFRTELGIGRLLRRVKSVDGFSSLATPGKCLAGGAAEERSNLD